MDTELHPLYGKELFATAEGTVYQHNRKGCFYVDFWGEVSAFKVPCFFALKKRVDDVDIVAMASNPSREYDYAIISPCGSERCYVLTLCEVLAFKDLLAGAKVMLELNSILYEKLYSVGV